ncbi:hypothetical protein BDD12DRAFT_903749 [Trichophaea hybrida]|nr:hypothetical protein BDD12DRAFT_903749 [Trichophaea hybrida]
MKIHQLLTLSGVIVAVTVLAPPFASAVPEEISLPCSYSRLAALTVHSECDGASSTVDMQAIPTPELRKLRRQTLDSLGWNDPSTCNVGICDAITAVTCAVYSGHGLRAETVTGACCAIGSICTSRSVCVPYTSHSFSTLARAAVTDGTAYCGSSYPYCYSLYYQYGYGLGTFLYLDCADTTVRTTMRNPSWALYASETNPAKGPMPTTTPISTEISSDLVEAAPSPTAPTLPPPSLSRSTEERNPLPVGAIAGIVIGSIIAIALAVTAIMVIWFKFRKANSNLQVMSQFQPKESISPAPVYYGSTPQSAQIRAPPPQPASTGY